MLRRATFKIACSFANLNKLQLQIVQNTIPNLDIHGYTPHAITEAVTKMDLSPASRGMISLMDVIQYQMQDWNKQALQQFDNTPQLPHRIKDKILLGIKLRLQMQSKYIDIWNQAMSIGAKPQNLQRTTTLLTNYANQIWIRCGDKSTDYNYYTKRALFTGAYAATQLHMLTDKSQNFNQTWKFLDRRLENILTLGKSIGQLKTVAGAAIDGIWNLVGSLAPIPSRQIKNPIEKQNKL